MAKIKLILFFALAVSFTALSGCLLPTAVDPAKSLPWDLASLNQAIQAPDFRRPKEPVVITGEVVSVFQGRHYSQVVSLAPPPSSRAGRREIIFCLFEKPAAAILPWTKVTIAGYLDQASVPDILILTAATLVRP